MLFLNVSIIEKGPDVWGITIDPGAALQGTYYTTSSLLAGYLAIALSQRELCAVKGTFAFLF